MAATLAQQNFVGGGCEQTFSSVAKTEPWNPLPESVPSALGTPFLNPPLQPHATSARSFTRAGPEGNRRAGVCPVPPPPPGGPPLRAGRGADATTGIAARWARHRCGCSTLKRLPSVRHRVVSPAVFLPMKQGRSPRRGACIYPL